MTRLFWPQAALLLGVTLVACAPNTPEPTAPAPKPSRSTAATLGIPPGHLPPPGHCRIWVPGRPPGHQPRSAACHGIEQEAPAGSWVLYRPTADKKVVHVRVVDERRPGVIVLVRVYDVNRGTLLKERRS